MAVRQGKHVVHLDQKNWIELARGYYGRTPDLQRIAQKVDEKSQSGQAIFPLSITHFDETTKNLNRERRQRLAKYMMLVSQGWTMLPASTIIVPEIQDACLKYLGLPRYDLQKFAIKKGMSQLLGAKADLVVKNTNNPFLKDLNLQDLRRELLEKVESPEALLWFMEHGFDRSEVKKRQEKAAASTEELEQIRLIDQSQIRDNDLRRRVTFARYFIQVVNPEVALFLLSINADPKIFREVLRDRRKIIQFFLSMPTSYCLVQLTHYRDMQRNRKIQPNDLNDIMSLSIAIPYSDVVVTETMWQSAIIQTKLNKLRPTLILKSAKELASILDPN